MPELPPKLDGPSRQPANGGAPKKLVVLLHGLGADGNDLIGLAPYWTPLLPDAEFLSPDAPFPCDMAPYGRQWFSVQNRTPETALAGARTAAPILNAFLDDALAKRGLEARQLALVGFSQGAMMSLFVGLRRAAAPAAIIAYSGALIAPQLLATEMRGKPHVLIVHGDADPVVPPSMLPAAVSALKGYGIAVEDLLRPGLGHSIDEEGLARGGAFLRAHFGRAT
jgi:phospholipase/carboxylesterase